MKKIIGGLAILLMISPVIADEVAVRKITLAKFTTNDGAIIKQPPLSPYWPRVDRHLLTIDDSGNIYILNLWNNEVIQFDKNGVELSRIELPGKPYKSTVTHPLSGEGYLEVTGDGSQLIVSIPTQKGYVILKNGKIVKELSRKETLLPFPDMRLCNGMFVNLYSGTYYDLNFKSLGKKYARWSDEEGQYDYDANNHRLIKYSSTKSVIWDKKFDGKFQIIGVDAEGFLYLHGKLGKADAYSLYKLNSSGKIVAKTKIPEPFRPRTNEEKNAWLVGSSEEFPSFFKLACDGSVYLIYQLSEIPKTTYQRWLNSGEYYIFKFEKQENYIQR